MRWLLVRLVKIAAVLLAGVALAVAVYYHHLLEELPELKPWHRVSFHEEFDVSRAGEVQSLADYVALEGRVLTDLRGQVVAELAPADRVAHNRYFAGSAADADVQPVNWNRTFELTPERARGGVLLLHGMSDSPYSLHAIGALLKEHGWHVLGLRLPGHGTAPSGLLDMTWKDLRAATRLGMRHLHSQLGPTAPLLIVGYSNGAALGTDYALSLLEGEKLPRLDGLILLSPALALSPIAGLAVWQSRVSHLPGLSKLAWLDVLPEYDPYKYNSFPVHAGDEVYRLARDVEERLRVRAKAGPVQGFPATLAFQSVIDATIKADGIANVLLHRVAPGRHSLVLYDINRSADAIPFVREGDTGWGGKLLEGEALPFALTLVTNENASSSRVHAVNRPAGGTQSQPEPLDLAWPAGVFALAHVSLPFPPHDPVYGVRPSGERPIPLGRLEARGETGLLVVPASLITRLRHNPFYEYQAKRIIEFADALQAK
jgi:alpha-beta hydrolase superfamily lysophospholipase